MVYPHCAYNELQKQNEMEDSEYTNFPVHVLTKHQKYEHNKDILYFQILIPLKEKTSIPKAVTEIHMANSNCVYCVQLISLAHVHSSGKGVAFRTKN